MMKIIDAIPATKIPRHLAQIYTYYSRKKTQIGSLVLVPLGKRKVKAAVVKIHKFNKLEIKNHDYQLRPIIKVIQEEPVLDKDQLRLAGWMSEYYGEPLSLIIKTQSSKLKTQNNNLKLKTLILEPKKGMYEKLFAKNAKLEKIIIKDEHSELYKSQRAPRINLRDVAIKLAQIKKIKFELKSETPSLESYYQYKLRPKIKKIQRQIINMQAEQNIISENLVQELKKAKSSLLFLNRLGAATLILCQDCGYVAKCENCDVPLVYHLAENQLICRYCNFRTKAILTCPKCDSWRIKYLGTGIEKVKQEIAKLNLDNKILVTTLKRELPKVDLIGVISVDTILNLPDFRSPERTFQALIKLNNLCKKMIIQTYLPEHYVFDFENFYQKELSIRKALNYPPFCQIIKLTYRHKNSIKARNEAYKLAKKLSAVLGPVPGFIPKKRGLYYWNIIIKVPTKGWSASGGKFKYQILGKVPDNWIIDVDPISLL